jgi:hypothetical protein
MDFQNQAEFIAQVAYEASEEPDAVEQHPEIVDVLRALTDDQERLHVAFGANGHDPVAFVKALADGLEIYRNQELEDAPELIDGLGFLGATLRHYAANGAVPHA